MVADVEQRLLELEKRAVAIGIHHARRIAALRKYHRQLVSRPDLMDKVLTRLAISTANELFLLAGELFILSYDSSKE